jgi:hypothetical protein
MYQKYVSDRTLEFLIMFNMFPFPAQHFPSQLLLTSSTNFDSTGGSWTGDGALLAGSEGV